VIKLEPRFHYELKKSNKCNYHELKPNGLSMNITADI